MANKIQDLTNLFNQEKAENAIRFSEIKSDFHRVFELFSIHDHRYHELKVSIDRIHDAIGGIQSMMATKGQLNQVFETLSQDITCLSGDSQKLVRRVDHLEKRVQRLEDKN